MDRRDAEQLDRRERLRRFLRPEVPLNSAWIGVQLSPLPAALANHLHLENKGVMISNIFEGSPADKAGLDRYDVIVAADGKPVSGGMDSVRDFSESVRDKRPGQAIELKVISRGQERAVRVELGQAPSNWNRLRPKYEEDPDVAFQREFGLRGRIFRPGPGGGWIVEDLDQFPLFRDRLERDLRGRRERQRDAEGPQEAEGDLQHREEHRIEDARRVDKDGTTLHVQRDESGRITVRRYKAGEDPDKTRAVYNNMDQLRQADREAHDLLQSAAPPSPPAPDRPTPPRRFEKPLQPYAPGSKPRPSDRSEAWREWERRFFQGPLKELRNREEAAPSSPTTSFDVAADGKITARFRKGDAEMTRTFNSREELRDKAPSLFERFEELEAGMKSNDQ